MPVKRPMPDRFWPKVQVTGFCWIWVAARTPLGYGRIGDTARKSGWAMAHRVAYELLVGPIPDGMVLDHLCRNPPCVNPDHLEPVTVEENNNRGFGWSGRKAKQTHCVRGHKLSGENVQRWAHRPSSRTCRECARERDKARVREPIPPGAEFGGTCYQGHEFTPENTYVTLDRTQRRCRECQRLVEIRTGSREPADDRTHCGRGHELTPENVSVQGGRRRCKACARIREARYREAKRDAA